MDQKLSLSELRSLYNAPTERAKNKTLTSLDKHALHFIAKSPFLILSTVNIDNKLDASPRGGNPGFVHVLNAQTIVIPDAKGNNRLDSLENICQTAQIGMLFLIPGINETLRLNGKAFISNEPEYLNLFNTEAHKITSCIVVQLEEVFLHCAKAFMRSGLWLETNKLARDQFPTMGQMLKDQLNSDEAAESQADMEARYLKDL